MCATQDRYYSHYRGAHGKGYTARCGKYCQWPASRARHHEKCDTCIEIIAREEREKEQRKRFNTASTSGQKKMKTEKDVKTEQEVGPDTLQDTKRRVKTKIENILNLKKDM